MFVLYRGNYGGHVSNPRIVAKDTGVTHVSVLPLRGSRDFTYEATLCGEYYPSGQWHSTWRSPPNNQVTCFACIAEMDG